MKKIILTIDYELFFGERTGSVKDCMIEPTDKLLKILKDSDCKMTIFWDILHFHKLIELEENYPELKVDRISIEKQIISMVKIGFDVQLHLHPHWLDAKYENNKWNFKYDRFKLQNLSDENNPEDINTILGCISISKKLIEDTIKKEIPEYKVTTFRAGGYLVEPFHKIKGALLYNEIKIESSVTPGEYYKNGNRSYDFRNYPNDFKYNFSSTPKFVVDGGDFIEVPITSIKIPIFMNLYFKLLKKMKYASFEGEIKGVGAGVSSDNKLLSRIKRLIKLFLSPQSSQFTTDSNFQEKFNYIYEKVPEYATMILHPKLLNSHSFTILSEYLSSKKIKFVSIKDIIK